MQNHLPKLLLLTLLLNTNCFTTAEDANTQAPAPQAKKQKVAPPAPPIIGVNIGKEYDQMAGKHPMIDYIQHLRVFILLEDVYNGKYPAANDPHYDPQNLDNWKYSMMGYRSRLKQMHEQGFDVRISLESIFEKDTKGQVLRQRKFPNKSFSRAEWGGNEKAIRANAKKLAVAIHLMFGDYVSRLEFTNEAWGEPGFDATKWIIKGLCEGFKEMNSPIKLSLGAYQAYDANNHWQCKGCDFPSGDYIGHVFEPWMLDYIDEITVHPYSFTLQTTTLTETPLDNPNSEFKYLYDMVKWRDKHCPDVKLSITEIGWNSAQVGEEKQALYLQQILKEAERLQLYAVYLYEAVDSPSDPVFSTCGLFTGNGVARATQRPKEFLVNLKKTKQKK